jgi:hypothetical protein
MAAPRTSTPPRPTCSRRAGAIDERPATRVPGALALVFMYSRVEYKSSMRSKTSITLSEETLRAIDRYAGKKSNRSRVIEEAVRYFLAGRARAARDARDLELIDRHAAALNQELADALDYQEDL